MYIYIIYIFDLNASQCIPLNLHDLGVDLAEDRVALVNCNNLDIYIYIYTHIYIYFRSKCIQMYTSQSP